MTMLDEMVTQDTSKLTPRQKAEATIERVLAKMTSEEVDQLAPDSGEFKQIAKAVMAWYQLLFASRILKRTAKVQQVMSSSLIVLDTLVKYTYALGRRRGRRDNTEKRRRK